MVKTPTAPTALIPIFVRIDLDNRLHETTAVIYLTSLTRKVRFCVTKIHSQC